MMRRLVKSGVACVLRWSGASLLIRRHRRSGTPWIVGYHRVVEDFASSARTSIAATLISRRMLERQLDWIGRHFDFVSLDDIGSHLERGERFLRPVAAVTFDDGYRDAYEQAFPLLKTRGIPAALFVPTGLVGTGDPPLSDRLYALLCRAWNDWPSPVRRLADIAADVHPGGLGSVLESGEVTGPFRMMRVLLETLPHTPLERLASALETEIGVDESLLAGNRPLTWEMLKDMQRAGVTIGSHSRTHPLLTRESGDRVARETLGSKRDLESRLGIVVRHFAYPNGWFNATTVGAVEAAGYRCAYTSCRHRFPDRPLLTLPRTLLWENSALGMFGRFSPSVLGCQADGTLDRLALCPLDHGN